MKFFLILISVLGLMGPAAAEPGGESPSSPSSQAQREQRRIELRNALQAQHINGDTHQARDNRRQLSAQEREELRQQLRQSPVRPSKPQS